MPYFKDITGERFGRLVVIEDTGRSKKWEGKVWRCQCDCGKITEVPTKSLRIGNTRSCGCLHNELQSALRRKDLTGMRFGSLVALRPTDKRKHGSIVWECICDCGNMRTAPAENLLSGNVKSCGCIRSRGNQKVDSILRTMGVKYQREFPVKIDGHRYKYDFAVLSEDGDVACLIEYDGVLHFEQDTYHGWNNEESWKTTKRHDEIKTNYAKQNSIPLLRIPYTDFDILDEKYLKERISDLCTVDML